MSISASHWGMICANVQAHANKIHPWDKKAARRLESHLLAITTEESMTDSRNELAKISERWKKRDERGKSPNPIKRWFWNLWDG